MTEMIERVAEAICRAQSFLPTPVTAVHRAAARAAIEAMREPTDDMIHHGAAGSGSDRIALGAWEAMMDAALK